MSRATIDGVRRQFEQLAGKTVRSIALILFQPAPGVTLQQALLACPFTRDYCTDGRQPDASFVLHYRERDDRSLEELVFASPYAGDARTDILNIARKAAERTTGLMAAGGVPDELRAESQPVTRCMKLLFWYARTYDGLKAYPLGGISYGGKFPNGEYEVLDDAVQYSLNVIGWLLESQTVAESEPAEPQTTQSSGVLSVPEVTVNRPKRTAFESFHRYVWAGHDQATIALEVYGNRKKQYQVSRDVKAVEAYFAKCGIPETVWKSEVAKPKFVDWDSLSIDLGNREDPRSL